MPTLVHGGIGGGSTYVQELVSGLNKHTGVSVTSLVSRAGSGTTGGKEFVLPMLRGGTGSFRRAEMIALSPLSKNAIEQDLKLADVVHYPLTSAIPTVGRSKVVLQTVHDLQHRDLPDYFSKTERKYRDMFYLKPLSASKGIIAISEFTKARLIEATGISPEKIQVIHQGVSEHFFPSFENRKNFIYYPASSSPHKNHSTLFRALKLLRKDIDVSLVLSGGDPNGLGKLPDGVSHLGWVSSEKRLSLYRQTFCLAFPSLYEGFGLPPLEAMACGTHVVSSDKGSLPEICGEGAQYFDGVDAEQLAIKIYEAFQMKQIPNNAGMSRIQKFSWETTVSKTIDYYKNVSST